MSFLNDRFWSKVEKTDTCWLWTGAKNGDGYGSFWFDGGSQLVHRLSWQNEVNDIPKGLIIDHLCRNRACVNVEHMELVTIQDNNQRGKLGDLRPVQKYCKRGHERTLDNLYFGKSRSGKITSACKRCNLDNSKRRYQLANTKELLE